LDFTERLCAGRKDKFETATAVMMLPRCRTDKKFSDMQT
jgi:hypothetical protein